MLIGTNIGELVVWNLPFDMAQGGELVEPFEIWFLVLGIFMIFLKELVFINFFKT
jgi:hypothetical protein